MVQTRALLLALLVAAGPAASQEVASIQLSHASVSLAVGSRQTVFATAYTAGGSPLSVQFRWTSGDAAVVAVEVSESESDFAELVAVGPGTARVTVRAGARSEAVTVTVTGQAAGGQGVAAALNIDPPTVQLLRGEAQRLRPVFLRADGELANGAPVQWASLNPAVANVDPATGVVVGISAGQGAVQATAGALNRIATVEVADAPITFTVPALGLSPGAEGVIEVTVPSQRGRPLAGDGLTWRSTNEQIVRVTPLGVARGVAPGRASVVVEGYGQVRELPVTVHRAVAFVDATPAFSRGPIQVPLSGSRLFRVVSKAADESDIPEAPVAWSVGDTTVAAFNPSTGHLTGRALGTTTLLARPAGPGLDITWQIEVIAGGIQIVPDRVGFGVGEGLALRANFTTGEGAPIGPAQGVQWLTENANVVRVDGEGRITGAGPGHARVIVSTPWGRADSTDVYVQGALLFTSSRTGSADLFTADPAAPSRETGQVTSDPTNEAMGAWSPDGSRLAFVSDRDGNYELYVSDADGATPRRLTSTADVAELTPEWTPDGRQIVYAAQLTGGRAQIWIMNADATDAHTLTSEAQGANLDPAVSADGRSIAFTTTRDGNYEIYVMDGDGTNQRPALTSPAKESKPAWFPNGDLGFVQERTGRGRLVPVLVRQQGSGGISQPISPSDLPITDFAVNGAGDLVVLEVATPAEGGRFERRLFLLPLGGTAVELPRQPGEQQSNPAFRQPLAR